MPARKSRQSILKMQLPSCASQACAARQSCRSGQLHWRGDWPCFNLIRLWLWGMRPSSPADADVLRRPVHLRILHILLLLPQRHVSLSSHTCSNLKRHYPCHDSKHSLNCCAQASSTRASNVEMTAGGRRLGWPCLQMSCHSCDSAKGNPDLRFGAGLAQCRARSSSCTMVLSAWHSF